MVTNGYPARIEVVMATYQGEAYLPQQLASIERQTHSGWVLVARDDGSTDATPEILDAFASRHPERVRIVRDGRGRLGPALSFSALLATSTTPWVALADQDDVWSDEKLDVLARRAEGLGRMLSGETPVAVHSDLSVVGPNLHDIAPSLIDFQRLRGGVEGPLARLLVRSHVTGCAMLVNRALIDRALPIPPEAIMHDAWLGLVASALGRLSFEPRPLVRYRQHGSSAVGARRHGLASILARALELPSAMAAVDAKLRQARVFDARFGTDLDPQDAQAVRTLLSLGGMPLWSRWRAMRRAGLVASDPWTMIGLALLS